jgi:hypothetical protein
MCAERSEEYRGDEKLHGRVQERRDGGRTVSVWKRKDGRCTMNEWNGGVRRRKWEGRAWFAEEGGDCMDTNYWK